MALRLQRDKKKEKLRSVLPKVFHTSDPFIIATMIAFSKISYRRHILNLRQSKNRS